MGPTKLRNYELKKRFAGLCPDCAEKEKERKRAEEKVEAGRKAVEMDLPELVGTKKQIEWANILRQKFIDIMEKCAEEDSEMFYLRRRLLKRGCRTGQMSRTELSGMAYDIMEFTIREKTEASFWIEARYGYENYDTAVSVYREMQETEKKQETDYYIPEGMEEEIAVAPEHISFSGIVEITGSDSRILVEYSKNDILYDIVRKKGYIWKNGRWERELSEKTGKYQDRAAEIGNVLLRNGFTIKLADEYGRRHAVDGNYIPEQKKWIGYNDAEGKYTIKWPRSDSREIYENARKIPSSRYASGSVYVKPEYYEEIEDFADMYGFGITRKAQKVICAFRVASGRIGRVVPADGRQPEEVNKLKEMLEKDGAIIIDLIDE